MTGDVSVQSATSIQKFCIGAAILLLGLLTIMLLAILFGVTEIDVAYIMVVGSLLGIIFGGLLKSNAHPPMSNNDD